MGRRSNQGNKFAFSNLPELMWIGNILSVFGAKRYFQMYLACSAGVLLAGENSVLTRKMAGRHLGF